MKIADPAFGLISGVGASSGLLPHVLALCVLLATGIQPRSVASLVVFTIGAKLLGEWLFWGHCKRRMDSDGKFKNWRTAVDLSLFSHPNVFVALLMILADTMVDASLVYLALESAIPLIWVFLALFGCQTLSSPIQGFLSDYFSQKKSMLFAALMGILALAAILEIPLVEKAQEIPMRFFGNLLGLLSFTLPIQILLILCGKGLLANLTVIARAAIAEALKFKAIEKMGDKT